MNRKNVIIIDANLRFLRSVIATNKVHISALITDYKRAEQVKQEFGEIPQYYRFPTDSQFEEMHSTDYNLTYEDIETYRSAQLKVEHFLHRYVLEIATIQNQYFTALAFWLGFFEKNNVDMVFSAEIEHGAIWDSLIMEIARVQNIPVYTISVSSGNFRKSLASVIYFNNKSFVNLSNIVLPKPDVTQYLTNLHQDSLNSTQKIGFKHPYKYFYNTRIKRIPHSIRNFFSTPYQRYKKLRERIDMLSQFEIPKSAKYVDDLKNLYDKLSKVPNYNEKYIYVPLHQDPEAVTMARPTLTSSLYMIKLLSLYCPKNWKIYVKEHPVQFFIYEKSEYFLKNAHYFRTPRFYKTLKMLKNVELIDIQTNGNELIANASAVASIGGSSIIQAAIDNKPIIIFGRGIHFAELLKDSFTIGCVKDVGNAMSQIIKDYPKKYFYEDIEDIMASYVFEINYQEQETQCVDLFHRLIKFSSEGVI